jgi:hypothetical protein
MPDSSGNNPSGQISTSAEFERNNQPDHFRLNCITGNHRKESVSSTLFGLFISYAVIFI